MMIESNSWVIIEKTTGKVICETFSRKFLAHLNTQRYRAVPTGEYLPKLNAAIKKNGGGMDKAFRFDWKEESA